MYIFLFYSNRTTYKQGKQFYSPQALPLMVTAVRCAKDGWVDIGGRFTTSEQAHQEHEWIVLARSGERRMSTRSITGVPLFIVLFESAFSPTG
jgi:hypothetical protein